MKEYYLPVFFVFNFFFASVHGTCPRRSDVITLQDAKDAAYASKEVYDDNLSEGDIIPNTQFRVTKRFHDQLQKNGEGIRVMVADNGNTRMIVYRGTDGFEQLMAQGKSAIFGDEEVWAFGGVKMEVLTFFFKAFQLSSYHLKPYIRLASKKYILTGHSLGGALASILALNSTLPRSGSGIWKNPKSCLITFGQPRVGGTNFAKLHDYLISTYRKLRFIYESDPVPRIPFSLTGWKHFSRGVYMGTERYDWWGKRSVEVDIDGSRNPNGEELRVTDKTLTKVSRNKTLMEAPRIWNGTLGVHNASKRIFWAKKRKYWKICKVEDEADCVPTFAWLNQNDHQMSNYINSLTNPPSHIYAKDGKNKQSLEEALFASCS